jgi:hypothetical protein
LFLCPPLILPGLYTVWVKGLAHVVPFAYTALFLIPLGGVLVFLATSLGPETLNAPLLGQRGRDRSLDELGVEPARGMAGVGRVRTGRAAGVGVGVRSG